MEKYKVNGGIDGHFTAEEMENLINKFRQIVMQMNIPAAQSNFTNLLRNNKKLNEIDEMYTNNTLKHFVEYAVKHTKTWARVDDMGEGIIFTETEEDFYFFTKVFPDFMYDLFFIAYITNVFNKDTDHDLVLNAWVNAGILADRDNMVKPLF